MINSCKHPPLITVCDITVKLREFPSLGRSFFNADTLGGTVRHREAESRIDLLPPVHSPLRGLHTVANDNDGSCHSSAINGREFNGSLSYARCQTLTTESLSMAAVLSVPVQWGQAASQ